MKKRREQIGFIRGRFNGKGFCEFGGGFHVCEVSRVFEGLRNKWRFCHIHRNFRVRVYLGHWKLHQAFGQIFARSDR